MAAAGIEASVMARSTSVTMSTCRVRIRSTHAPAGRPTSRKATLSTAVSKPTWSVDACNTRMAVNGRASSLTMDPKRLTVCAAQRRRKSR
jgi:hypothetical protein